MLRSVTIAVCLCAAAYGGYWFYAAHTAEKATLTAISRAEALGYDITYGDIGVKGFPSRLDQTATDLSITFPDGQSGVDLPWLKLYALSYQPTKVIADFPPAMDWRIGGTTVAMTHDDLRARVDVGFDTSLPLQQAVMEGSNLRFATDDWSLTTQTLLAALRPSAQVASNGTAYDFWAELHDIAPPAEAVARVDAGGTLPATLDSLKVDAVVAFAEPIVMRAPPVLTGLSLREATLTWGDTGLTVTGNVMPDDQGRATGLVEVSLRNWPALLRLATGAGLVSAEYEGLISQALQLVGRGQATVTAPITLEGGQMRIGFLPLGPAPVLPFTLPG